MSFKLIDLKCSDCEHVREELVTTRELEANKFDCPACGGEGTASRIWAGGYHVLNHSYVDGTKREGFSELKLSSELESMAYSSSSTEDRNRLLKEAHRVKQIRR